MLKIQKWESHSSRNQIRNIQKARGINSSGFSVLLIFYLIGFETPFIERFKTLYIPVPLERDAS